MNWKCRLGFHSWELVDRNILSSNQALFRTYKRCSLCQKYGECVYFEKQEIRPPVERVLKETRPMGKYRTSHYTTLSLTGSTNIKGFA